MSRYNSQGYRKLPGIDAQPRRQILGYSRQVQGGADQARARADQRRAEGWNPALRQVRERQMRVDEAKAAGTFDETRDAYNEEAEAMGSDYRMDQQGGIRRSYLKAKTKYVKKPASDKPLIYRPASQRIKEMTTVPLYTAESRIESTLAKAAKEARARRRNTLVIQ